MSGADDDVARFFADIARRRELAVSAAEAEIAQVTASGDGAVTEIEQDAQAAVRAASSAVEAGNTTAQEERTPEAWAADEDDPERRFLRAITDSDESAEDSEPGRWPR